MVRSEDFFKNWNNDHSKQTTFKHFEILNMISADLKNDSRTLNIFKVDIKNGSYMFLETP